MHNMAVKFTWHENKRKANLSKHGFDFVDAEQRFNSTGFLGMAIVTICHTETDDEIHVISMRKAEPDEIEILSHYL